MVTIILYQYSGENFVIDKSGGLIGEATITGDFKEAVSVTNPVFVFDKDIAGAGDFNYFYIPIFNRYYFVVDITHISAALIQVTGEEDVLYTYKNALTSNIECVVKRNEYLFNPMIHDERIPTTTKLNKEIIIPRPEGNYFTLTDRPFPDGQISRDIYRYVVMTGGNLRGTSESNLQTVFDTCFGYILTRFQLMDFMDSLLGVDTGEVLSNLFSGSALQSLVSIRVYPIDFYNYWSYQCTDDGRYVSMPDVKAIVCGSYTAHVDAKNAISGIENNNIYYLSHFDKIVPESYIDTEATYQLYLPFYGFLTLNAGEILNKYIDIQISIDFYSGMGTYFIYASDTNIIPEGQQPDVYPPVPDSTKIGLVATAKCSIAIDIPFSQSNALDITRNLITSTISAAVNTASGNPTLPGGSIDSFVTQISRGGASGGSFLSYLRSGINMPYIVKLTQEHTEPTNFKHFNGKPTMETHYLSELHGYTEIEQIHLSSDSIRTATMTEKAQIESLLKSGVIFPYTTP